MSIASRVMERFRNRLIKQVDKKRRETQCAKTAIAEVARKVGMSTVNVYRVMNGYGNVTIKAHHYVALLMASMAPAKRAGRKLFNREQPSRAGLNA